MGRVVNTIKLTNLADRTRVEDGRLTPAEIRSVELEALVDTGATMLVLPEEAVAALGVAELRRVGVRMADGSVRTVPIIGGLELEILGRAMICDALVMPAGTTPLIGQIPLERLDLVVDPKSRTLTVNPLSPDSPLLDLLHVA